MMVTSGTGSTTGVTPGVTIMRNIPHLYCKHGAYYARLRTPRHLINWFDQHEFRWSLRTGHLKTARHRLHIAYLIISDLFEKAQLQTAHTPLQDDEKAALKQRIQELKAERLAHFKKILADGDAGPLDARDFLAEQRPWINHLKTAIEMDDFDQPEVILPASEVLSAVPRISYDFSSLNPNLRYLARQYCASMVALDSDMHQLLRKPKPSVESVNQIIAGHDVNSSSSAQTERQVLITQAEPAASESQPQTEPTSLPFSQLLAAYMKEQKTQGRTAKTLKCYQDEYQRFIDFSGDIACDQITREITRGYRDALLLHPNRQLTAIELRKPFADRLLPERGDDTLVVSTVKKYLQRLEQIFVWGRIEGYTIRENLTKNLALSDNRRDRDKRDRFEPEELVTLFSTPIFQGQKPFAKTAHYWAPLISLYSMVRMAEVCQLRLDDFCIEGDVHYIDINAKNGKRLKPGQASARGIPIHSKLIELGLLDFVSTMRERGHSLLFPTLNAHPLNGPGHSVSNWFSHYKIKLGFNKKKVFHSLRHTGTDESLQTGLNEMVTNSLAGHVGKATMSVRTYGKDLKPARLQSAIEDLSFDIPAKRFSECKFLLAETKALMSPETAEALRNKRLIASQRRKAAQAANKAPQPHSVTLD